MAYVECEKGVAQGGTTFQVYIFKSVQKFSIIFSH